MVPKTLVFCKDESHAEDTVHIVREVFGKGNDFAKKITYKSNNPETSSLVNRHRGVARSRPPRHPQTASHPASIGAIDPKPRRSRGGARQSRDSARSTATLGRADGRPKCLAGAPRRPRGRGNSLTNRACFTYALLRFLLGQCDIIPLWTRSTSRSGTSRISCSSAWVPRRRSTTSRIQLGWPQVTSRRVGDACMTRMLWSCNRPPALSAWRTRSPRCRPHTGFRPAPGHGSPTVRGMRSGYAPPSASMDASKRPAPTAATRFKCESRVSSPTT